MTWLTTSEISGWMSWRCFSSCSVALPWRRRLLLLELLVEVLLQLILHAVAQALLVRADVVEAGRVALGLLAHRLLGLGLDA